MASGPAFTTGFWQVPTVEEDLQRWYGFLRPLPFTEGELQRCGPLVPASLDRPFYGPPDLFKYRGALGTNDNIKIRPETVDAPWKPPPTAPRPRDHHRHHQQLDASFHLDRFRGPKKTVDTCIRPEMVHAPIGGAPSALRPPSRPLSIAAICNTSEPMRIGEFMLEMAHVPIGSPPPAPRPRPHSLSIAALCNTSNPMNIDALLDLDLTGGGLDGRSDDDSSSTVMGDITTKATATQSPPPQGNAGPTDPKDILGPLLRTLPNQQRRSEGTHIGAAPPLYAPVPQRQSDLAILDYEDSSEVAGREDRDDGLVHDGTHDVVMHDASMDDDPRRHTI